MKLLVFALLASVCTLRGQSLSRPLAGLVVDPAGDLCAVSGFSGSLLPLTPISLPGGAGPLGAAAFNGVTGAVKSTSQLFLLNAEGAVESVTAAPPGPALFSFQPDGTVAWIYFASEQVFRAPASTASFHLSASNKSVIALGAAGSNGIPMLTQTGSQLWSEQVSTDGGTISQTPISGSAPAIWFEGGWLVSAGPALLWYPPGSGTPQKIPFSQPGFSQPMNTLQTAGAHFVVVNGRWLIDAAWRVTEIPSRQRNPHHRTDAP